MADKYKVLSVKSPVIAPPPGSSGYPDTFTNWTELELKPWLEPGIAAIGGYSTERKILISTVTYASLLPLKGDIIELSITRFRSGAEVMRIEAGRDGEHLPPPKRWRPVSDVLGDVLDQLKRLNNNLEKDKTNVY